MSDRFGMPMVGTDKEVIGMLRAKVTQLEADLAAEREKVRELEQSEENLNELMNAAVDDYTEVKKQLAAKDLDNQRLREALSKHSKHRSGCFARNGDGEVLSCLCGLQKALSTPADTAALDAYVAEKVEPWKKDAERYRWLRDSGRFCPCPFGQGWGLAMNNKYSASDLDNAADSAAVAAQENKHG